MPLSQLQFGLSRLNSVYTGTLGAITLSGAVAGGDQTWTNVGDMTFAAGSILASGSTNGNTLLLRANDTTLMTFTTGATDTLDIGAHSISGDVTVASTKGINFDTYGIKITDTYIQFGDDSTALGPKLKWSDVGTVVVRNAADNANGSLTVSILSASSYVALATATGIYGPNTDSTYFDFQVRDNSVGRVAVARAQGAADPYFMVGRDDTGVALNTVTDMFYLQAGSGTGNNAANFGLGVPWYLGNAASEVEERGSIDLVLTTATNGAEAAQFNFNVQAAGAAPSTILSLLGKSAFMGTSGAPIAMVVGTPTFALYTTCADEGTGNAIPFYVKSTMTGAGGYGARSQFDMTANVALGGYANALKAYTSFGATGKVTGLASAFCGELALSAGTTAGSYAALEAELVAATGDPVGASTSFIYCNAGGTGSTTVIDAQASLFYFGPQLSAGANGFIDTDITAGTHYGGIRIKMPDGSIKYLAVVSA